MSTTTLIIIGLFVLAGLFSHAEKTKRESGSETDGLRDELAGLREEMAKLREHVADLTLDMRELRDNEHARIRRELDK